MMRWLAIGLVTMSACLMVAYLMIRSWWRAAVLCGCLVLIGWSLFIYEGARKMKKS